MALPFYTPAGAQMGLFQPQQGGIMGLLNNPNFQKALLSAGAGVLSARTGGSTGAALGQGLMQGMQTYEGLKSAEQQAAERAQQMGMQERRLGMEEQDAARKAQQFEQEADRQARFEIALQESFIRDENGVVTGLDPGKYRAALAIIAPEKAGAALYQQATADKSYYQPVYDAQKGLGAFNARTGQVEWQGGFKPEQDPTLRGRIAGAETAGRVGAEAQTRAQIDLPAAEGAADVFVGAIDSLINHPGRKQATGSSRMLGVQMLPGTAAYDFDAKAKEVQGKIFKQAFETLKGAGAITEQEGQAARDAMANLDAAQSEEQYLEALTRLKGEVARLRELVRARAGQAPTLLTPNAPTQSGWSIRPKGGR